MQPENIGKTVCPTTLENLFEMKCARGEGIRLEMLEGDPGELQLTLRQIKAAIRAAMRGLARDVFVLTFKRGDRHVAQHQANNPWIIGDENYYHAMMTPDKLNELRERQMSSDRTAGVCWK